MKRLASLLLLAIAGTAQASHAPNHSFTGFYAKGALGLTSSQFEVLTHFYEPDLTGSFPGVLNLQAGNGAGLIGLGYLYQYDKNVVLGIEASAGYTQTEAKHENQFYDTVIQTPNPNVDILLINSIKSQLTNDFALIFKPGILSGKNTLLYALVGPRWGHFDSTVSTVFNISSNGMLDEEGEASSEVSTYQLGLTAGVGIQQMLGKQFHLSLEYAFTTYGDIHAPSVMPELYSGGMDTGNNISSSPEIEVNTNTVILAVSYQW